MNPFLIEEHQIETVNIHSGKLFMKTVNVDKCVSVVQEELQEFIESLPNGFYNTLKRKVQARVLLKNK